MLLLIPKSSMTIACPPVTSDPGAMSTLLLAGLSTSSEFAFSSSSFFDGGAAAALGTIHDPNDALAVASAALSTIWEILASTKTSDFEPINNNPLVFLSTIVFVTLSDMVPFVPCQPLAISLGARYGPWAFPICVCGQTLAGVLAFSSSRRVSDSEKLRTVLESIGSDGKDRFRKFQTETLLLQQGDDDENPPKNDSSSQTDERTVFLALVGLRLAPFFPFSAGNYLLGGATNVGLRPFVLATILGCVFSNAVSVLVGMGGAELVSNAAAAAAAVGN